MNLQDKLGKGLKPKAFIESMSVNQEKFHDVYESFTWKKEDEEYFASLKENQQLQCFILAADWCGDVVRNVPIVFHAMEKAEIPTEVLVMEQNLDVMDQHLTMGGRSIPIVIFTDLEGNELKHWGPRPQRVQEPMVQFKRQHPTRDGVEDYEEKIKDVYREIGKRYGEGNLLYQEEIIHELRVLISSI
ncbi:thioredoxin family protein [Ammoniphilus sp. CFH 90114]|uniref:thioredoxin family protein n=1 Tax=Ammoniphilus sp. CFH 90114 TaxID=2493665 RepID=UPI00100E3E8A|nr:thioredoxin family protein [Ammoniphilus sp. CFH 90114]RXT15312.1 thioredoxin family protein [Ammoniphilus sp. CFH 90114]